MFKSSLVSLKNHFHCMDLLSSYDDEISSASKLQQSRVKDNKLAVQQKKLSLQSEWESFEKMIGSGESSESDSPMEKENRKGGELRSSEEKAAEEEDESHLPPGVRKHNRCHSSSSSEDESDKKPQIDDSSDSESDDGHKFPSKDKTSVASLMSSETSSRHETKEKESSSKVRSSRSKSGSRSRSRSRSPRKKKRRSSDRSRHSRSRSRDRDRDRRRRKERRRRSRRTRSRSRSRSRDRRRSRDRDRYRHRRDHKRSRSRDRRDRGRDSKSSRDRSRRSRSRERDRERDRKRDRSRTPSPPSGKVIKYGDTVIKPGASFGRPSNFAKPLTFKEKMRQQLIKAIEDGTDVSQALTNKDGTVICTQTAGIQQQIPQPKKPPVPLMANIVTSTAGLAAMTATASEAAMQSMIALQKEATEKTGIEIPKYYNPAAINPMKYAEQVQKRKLLWSKTKDKEVNSQWHATSLSGDHDDKSKEKFRKLMGIKQDSQGEGEEEIKDEQEEKQKQLFDQLDKEYQYARMATHTHRGIGLGFGSSNFQPPGTGT